MEKKHIVVTSRDALTYHFFDRDSAIDCAKKFRADLGIAASVVGPGYEVSAAEIRDLIDDADLSQPRTRRLRYTVSRYANGE